MPNDIVVVVVDQTVPSGESFLHFLLPLYLLNVKCAYIMVVVVVFVVAVGDCS